MKCTGFPALAIDSRLEPSPLGDNRTKCGRQPNERKEAGALVSAHRDGPMQHGPTSTFRW